MPSYIIKSRIIADDRRHAMLQAMDAPGAKWAEVMDPPKRRAVVSGADAETVARYLPANYRVVDGGPPVLIEGEDNAGWTMDGYVIPRLASGLIYATEVPV